MDAIPAPVCPIQASPSPAPPLALRYLLVLTLVLTWTPFAWADAWTPVGVHRFQSLTLPTSGKTGFQLLPPEATGLTFTNLVPESRYWTNQLLLDGGGVTAADIDGDGLVDLFFTGQTGLSSLWRNLGDWKFTNITVNAFGSNSVLADLDGLGCAFADFNGDGAPDLVVNSHGQGTFVFFNDGSGHFKPHPVTLNPGRGGYTVAIADVDGDGWLDLYICNYRVRALMDMPNARATLKTVNGKREVATVDGRPTTEPDLTNRFIVNARGGVDEVGEPDVLYHNLGGTNFVAVPWTDGAFLDEAGHPLTNPPFDWGLAAMFRDLNGDGHPDLYVCNDFQSPDRFWLNQSTPGHIQFRLAPTAALRHTSFFSMGVDFADVNRDGHDDFIVLDMMSRDHRQRMTQLTPPPPDNLDPRAPSSVMQYPVNALQMGRGDGTFAEAAAFAGLQATEWSWTPIFLDVDLDGWEDLLVSNGQWKASRDLDVIQDLARLRRQKRLSDREIFSARKAFPRFETAKLAFQNDQSGRFLEVGAAWGFDTPAVAHGMCVADLDGDGDLDVIANRLNGPALIYRNETIAGRLAIRLASDGPNRFGVGAKITVRANGDSTLPVQTQQIIAGGRYLSGDTPERVFATGKEATFDVEVQWPDGRQSRLTNALANRRYELHPEASQAKSPREAIHPWFEDWRPQGGPTLCRQPAEEASRQPMLPRSLSTEGPGVTLIESGTARGVLLVVGSGKLGDFLLEQLDPVSNQWIQTNQPTTQAQTTLLPWGTGLLVGQSTYPTSDTNALALATWPVSDNHAPSTESSVGPLAAADVDGDGSLEVFVGGRMIPGYWPIAATSRLIKSDGTHWTELQSFPSLGLVQGAVFTDLDLDGLPDLAVAAEWGPPKLFRNQSHRLVEWDAPIEIDGHRKTLSSLKGWWTCIQAGDFDGDGRPDLVIGNVGENDFHALYGTNLAIFHGDLLGTGNYDVLEGYVPVTSPKRDGFTAADYWPVQSLSQLGQFSPALRERFPTHRQFSEARMVDVLGASASAAKIVEASYFSSVILLNRGDHFVLRRLPSEAQWSTVWGIVVADWDGDGHEDLFLSQNFFGQNFGVPRADAGMGLILRGDGRGGFTALSPDVSGIRMEGEGRGAATADFDRDGRPDFAVAQVNGPIKLYRNTVAHPGLRVSLASPEANSHGIGATVWLVQSGKAGPAREIRLGGGHWSVDATTTVLARPIDGPSELHVRWPGGKVTITSIAPDRRAVTIKPDGFMLPDERH